MTVLSFLGFKVPEYTDDVHIPTYWAEMIARLEELLLLGDGRVAWSTGDLKQSSQAADHGRWLKMDGRELTQANIEAALGLVAGQGKPICDYLKLGGESKYGAAAAGKIKLPDTRRKIPMSAGPAGDGDNAFTARALGSAEGAELVKLTGAQSGIKAHKHTITDPKHKHTTTDPGHGHTASQAAHNHAVVTFDNMSPGQEFGNEFNTHSPQGGFVAVTTWGRQNKSGETDVRQPSVTVNNAVTGVSINEAVTGITINEVANAEATEGHPNMPPFVTVGFYFIRV